MPTKIVWGIESAGSISRSVALATSREIVPIHHGIWPKFSVILLLKVMDHIIWIYGLKNFRFVTRRADPAKSHVLRTLPYGFLLQRRRVGG